MLLWGRTHGESVGKIKKVECTFQITKRGFPDFFMVHVVIVLGGKYIDSRD